MENKLDNDQDIYGLGTKPEKEWPKIEMPDVPPIDRVGANEELHTRLKDYFLTRLTLSENRMANFHSRWQIAERKLQGYIKLPDWEQLLKEMNNDKGKPPKALSVTIPFTYAVVATIATYLLHTYTGRRPMFQVGTYKSSSASAAQNMEMVLQYNADHTRLVRHMWRFLMDSLNYGVGIFKCHWRRDRSLRTKWVKAPAMSLAGGMVEGGWLPRREEVTSYLGNEVTAHDPFLFFPDPRCSMHEVNRKGEFVFFRDFMGRHALKRAEAAGDIKWLDKVVGKMPTNMVSGSDQSVRNLRSEGDTFPTKDAQGKEVQDYMQVDQGTCELIPAELGLGPSTTPEKWWVVIVNKDRIVKLEPFGADHDMHPCAVAEPFALGYGFGHLGAADYAGPFQDLITWLVNSHISNVRTVLNNKIIVDPSRIEMKDLRESADGGWMIRLKPAAFGMDVNTVAKQFEVMDVTARHLNDAEAIAKFGQMMLGTNENLMGQQNPGGRKTATEVRTSGEAGASRLAATARVISAQGIVDLTEIMTTNILQYFDQEFEFRLLGVDAQNAPLRINPDMLSGDFHFPIHDGTLPLDRVALLDVWKEIFLAVTRDQELRATYSVPRIFDWIAELGGARNIETMKMQPNGQPVPGQMPMVQAQVAPEGQDPSDEGAIPIAQVMGALG